MFRTIARVAALALVASAFLPAAAPAQEPWKLGLRIADQGGNGCLIHEVFAGSPAEQFGLAPGDVLLTVNGYLASDANQVRDAIFASDNVRLVLQRNGSCYETAVAFAPQANNGTVVTTTAMASRKVVTSVTTKAVAKPPLGKKPTASSNNAGPGKLPPAPSKGTSGATAAKPPARK